MAKYKHRQDGHVVEATEQVDSQIYLVENYYEGLGNRWSKRAYLIAEDFEALFEPIPDYCCDWFTKCVEGEVFRKSTASRRSGQVWAWDALDEYFDECPFCKTKL